MSISMRTLIQNVKTGMFYASDGQWTTEREDARDFGGTFQALSFAAQQHLHGVQVLLAFERSQYDITINFERPQPPPGTYREGAAAD
jgi:hypothetical protein